MLLGKTNQRALALAFALFGASTFSAKAASILETATVGSTDTGSYSIYSNSWIGAAFTLTQTTNITSIGANFDNAVGDLFGAIIALPPGFNPSNIGVNNNALAYTLLHSPAPGTVPGNTAVDISASIQAQLQPGTYGVIFGSGEFGANGSAGMVASNDLIGDPTFFRAFFGNWMTLDDGIRIFVEGTPVAAVPEPSTWAMMILGFCGVGFLAYRRRGQLSNGAV
ncbi:PEPxxWA-CTERM sorting domain-containing protein [Bradyrhizobium sp. AS23.2]|uniref:PEPxxWA-CTERM sorting domain-containing protein n=1 Tax=Bradyrhizobium sp. AS23.2 TaxID=1680155 RepID=UPI00093C2E5E|nr:PEPxxWA-CTERM sorting domain-containing protein [Bradyrhizobium sp. AS23.2]OKO86835.1 hypothetical protein AC630_01960 [Bradyrhizobium sp. AS23.2]